MIKGIFITGTDTDIGKTYVTARLVKQLKQQGIKVAYYKAALSGAKIINGQMILEDMEVVFKYADLKREDCIVSFAYKDSYAPYLAAKGTDDSVDLKTIKRDLVKLEKSHDLVIIEGSGGIICPLRDDDQQIMLTDVMMLADYPLIIVSPSGLGSINSSVLTVEYAKKQGLKILGLIMNNFEKDNILHQANKIMIEKLSGFPVLGFLEQDGKNIDFFEDKFMFV